MRVVLLVLVVLAPFLALAGEASPAGAGSETPRPTVEALDFIAGSWEGELFGGRAEESWMAPREGTLVGTFRLTWPGEPRKVYELFLVETVADGGVEMTFRHFSPGMELWPDEIEAPKRFRLVETGPRRAVFEAPDPRQKPFRLEFVGAEDGRGLTVTVQSAGPDGTVAESFDAVYRRAGSP